MLDYGALQDLSLEREVEDVHVGYQGFLVATQLSLKGDLPAWGLSKPVALMRVSIQYLSLEAEVEAVRVGYQGPVGTRVLRERTQAGNVYVAT